MTSRGQCPRGGGACECLPPPFRKSCIRAWIGAPPQKKALSYFAHCPGVYGSTGRGGKCLQSMWPQPDWRRPIETRAWESPGKR